MSSREQLFSSKSWLGETLVDFANKIILLGQKNKLTKEDLFSLGNDLSAERCLKEFKESCRGVSGSLSKRTYKYVRSTHQVRKYWEWAAIQWFLAHFVQVFVPLLLEDYIDWFKMDPWIRPSWKGWVYPFLIFAVFVIRMLTSRRAMFNILLTCCLITNTYRVFLAQTGKHL